MNTTTQPIIERLISLAAKTFGKDATGLSAGDDFFEALGIDSMQAMDLLTDLEEAFGVEIPDYELADIRTFEQLADIVGRRV